MRSRWPRPRLSWDGSSRCWMAWPAAWTITRFARVGHPLRVLDDLTTSSVTVEVAGLRTLAFLLGRGLGGGLACFAAIRLAR